MVLAKAGHIWVQEDYRVKHFAFVLAVALVWDRQEPQFTCCNYKLQL